MAKSSQWPIMANSVFLSDWIDTHLSLPEFIEVWCFRQLESRMEILGEATACLLQISACHALPMSVTCSLISTYLDRFQHELDII